MPTSDFELPINARKAIEKEWECALTEETITRFEGAACVAILMLATPQLSAEDSAQVKRDVRAARKRHANIAKAADNLLQLLRQDDEDLPQVTLRRKTDDNVLERVAHQTTVDEAISSMKNLVRLASRPYPAWIEGLAAPKDRNSKSWSGLHRDVWNSLILDLMVIYIEQTGQLPTISRDHYCEAGYKSPFFLGLCALYDVLPDDVRRTAVSTSALGSRASEILKELRGGLTGMRTQIQRQQKKTMSSA